MSTFRLWIYRILTGCLPETRCFAFKRALLSWCGARVGGRVRICSSAVFLGNGGLTIGDDVWIGARVLIAPVGASEVSIGAHCDIGPCTMILTGSHQVDPEGEHIGGKGGSASVKIGEGCWLGARSTILPGVELAKKTLVAAGAVVTADFGEENCLIAGVPAKMLKIWR